MSAAGPELPGARVLDLFAGSGALGLEALSRGAAEAVFVERGRDALRALRDNVRALGAEAEVTVVTDDVFRYLERDPKGFDIAFADPPYGSGDAAALVAHLIEEQEIDRGELERLQKVIRSAKTRERGDGC